jgi:hypothetical protein
MTTYYVKKTGNDGSGDGSDPNPWLTITYALSQATTNDTIYVYSGTYVEVVRIQDNGVTVEAPAGQTVIIDGGWDLNYPCTVGLPTGDHYADGSSTFYKAMVELEGDDVTFKNFTVRNSRGRGILIEGDRCLVEDCESYNAFNNGLHFHEVNVGDAEDVLVYNTCLQRLDPDNPTATEANPSGDWPVAVNCRRGTDVTLTRVTSHSNQGEGINLGGTRSSAYNCVSYNNRALNLYMQQAYSPIADGCLVFCTSDATYGPSPGIVIANEYQFAGAAGDGHRIVNCIVMNCRDNIAFWSQDKGALNDVVIANNILINAQTNVAQSKVGQCLQVDTPASGYAHSNTLIHSNIIVQTDTSNGESALLWPGPTTGVTFSNNAWNSTPASQFRGAGDIYTFTLSEFVNAGSGILGTAVADPDNYMPATGASTIDAGRTPSDVATDFDGNPRGGSPDIGAYEDDGGATGPPPGGGGGEPVIDDTFTDGTTSPASSLTVPITLSNDVDRILVFLNRAWWTTNNATVTTATYNGTNLTELDDLDVLTGSYYNSMIVYKLDAPDTGSSYDLEFAYTQSVVAQHVTVVALSNSQAIGTPSLGQGSSNSPSGSVTSTAANSLIIGSHHLRGYQATPFSEGLDVTELVDENTGGTSTVSDFGVFVGSKSAPTASASYTIDSTGSVSDTWIAGVVEVTGYPASADEPNTGTGTGEMGIGQDEANTSTGEQTILFESAMNSTPSGVLFLVSTSLVSGVAADDALICVGAATKTDQMWSVCASSDHGVATTDTRRHAGDNACIRIIDPSTGTVTAVAEFVSMDVLGVTIDWTDAPPAGYIVQVVAYNALNAQVLTATPNATQNSSETVDINFAFDVLFVVTPGQAFDETSAAEATLSLGICIHDGASLVQNCLCTYLVDNQAAGSPAQYVSDDYVGGLITSGAELSWAIEVENRTTLGFDITTRLGAAASQAIGVLAMNFATGVNPSLQIIDSPTAVGETAYDGFNQTPQNGLILMSGVSAVDSGATAGGAGRYGVGAFSGDEASQSMSVAEENDADPTSSQSVASDDIRLPTHDAATQLLADISSIDEDGFTLDATEVP